MLEFGEFYAVGFCSFDVYFWNFFEDESLEWLHLPNILAFEVELASAVETQFFDVEKVLSDYCEGIVPHFAAFVEVECF